LPSLRLKLRKNWPAAIFEVLSVGPFTVRLRREDGAIISVKRRHIEQQLPTTMRTPKIRFAEVPTPMGGQVAKGRARRRPR
jgi:hypothetical protein